MSFTDGLMQAMLKQADPNAQLEKDVVASYLSTQEKLANVQVATAISSIADKIAELEKNGGSQVAITALEKLAHSMA